MMHFSAHRSTPRGSGFRVLPTTALGRLATSLAAIGTTLLLVSTVVSFGAGLGFVTGLAASVTALIAIVRRGERALAVHVALLLPGLFVVAFVLADLLIGLD